MSSDATHAAPDALPDSLRASAPARADLSTKSDADDDILSGTTSIDTCAAASAGKPPEVEHSVAILAREPLDRSLLECALCLKLLCQPLTLSCGHTFCRACVRRALQFAPKCPVCRAPVLVGAAEMRAPSVTLVSLLEAHFPDEYADRLREVAAMASGEDTDLHRSLPLFVHPPTALLFPGQPVVLHFFEPRYLLLVDQCVSSDRQFGVQRSPDSTWGCIAEITGAQQTGRGTYLVHARGVGRYRVVDEAEVDATSHGLYRATIAPVEDMPDDGGRTSARMVGEDALPQTAEEASAHARERSSATQPGEAAEGEPDTSSPAPPGLQEVDPHHSATAIASRLHEVLLALLQSLSAQELRGLRAEGGHIPAPSNPVSFSFWLASVVSCDEATKELLLRTTSTTTRLSKLEELVLGALQSVPGTPSGSSGIEPRGDVRWARRRAAAVFNLPSLRRSAHELLSTPVGSLLLFLFVLA
eukprot:CAMPEP_0196777210 /NCGR_PEP_ID=MMETSP1104-20130614/5089_1 /TAXON_ID=33652 /ORGANISM="Cafeteria sp., Strain Caron Lab Isolate" /LENGTH=472 /DNA_ID=CAMNT_0042147377 /DNA_START=18 /DNA_END=1432 /DNA_ORIENTATION=+